MNELKAYYFTFGQEHPLRYNWVEIHASSDALAREKIVELFGTNWVFQYEDADFKPDYFPGGRSGKVIEVI